MKNDVYAPNHIQVTPNLFVLFCSREKSSLPQCNVHYTTTHPPPPPGVAPWSISSPVPHRNLENRYSEVEFYLRPILPPQIANKDLLK